MVDTISPTETRRIGDFVYEAPRLDDNEAMSDTARVILRVEAALEKFGDTMNRVERNTHLSAEGKRVQIEPARHDLWTAVLEGRRDLTEIADDIEKRLTALEGKANAEPA